MATERAPSTACARRRAFAVLGASVALLVFVRLRGRIPVWRAFHRWLASLGVPDEVRPVDASLLLLGGAFLAAWFLARGRAAAALGLARPVGSPARIAAVGALPMFAAAWVVRQGVAFPAGLVAGVLVAPFVEEVFFRACLVALPVRTAGLSFWPLAALAAALFGASHVPWSESLTWGQFPVALVTGAGGLWFAWLFRRAGWNLWLPVLVHAAMNLPWMLFGVSPDAVGGWTANLGRAGTVALVTVLTLRQARHPPE